MTRIALNGFGRIGKLLRAYWRMTHAAGARIVLPERSVRHARTACFL